MDHAKTLATLIDIVVKERASDLHLSVGLNPMLRVDGSLIPLMQQEVVTQESIGGVLAAMLSENQRKMFVQNQHVDFSYAHGPGVRFRGNAFIQRGTIAIAMRYIPELTQTFADLRLPQILETFAQLEQGFFLVVGPVGQGKSTTLAAMVEYINQNRSEHILTIEDPIEYIFTSKRAVIEQREVGVDTPSFEMALHSAFRQDIDVIMVGEMRNLETISTAVTAAETGHLVLATLHTNNAPQTIDRIIDSFPGEQQTQIRTQLANSLTGILSQRLIPKISGGMVPAFELLINTNAVGNLIRAQRTHEIASVVETSAGDGMIDMNRSLAELVRRGEVTPQSAYARSLNPKGLERLL